jgi:hypothetical protein
VKITVIAGAGSAVVALAAGCSSAVAPSGGSAPPAAVQHPTEGCWTVAKPYVAKVAADLVKQDKFIAGLDRSNPALTDFNARAAAGAWLSPGTYSADVAPFGPTGSMRCSSGTAEDGKATSEAQFDSDFNALVGDVGSFQTDGTVAEFQQVKNDLSAVESDYQYG